jgi:RimJ/RimL family protein N-acetyltransferase
MATPREERSGDGQEGTSCAPRVVLRTSRLCLREMVPADLDFLAALLADPEVMRFYPSGYTRKESEGWLERTLHRYATDGHAFWLVEDLRSGEPLGQVGLIEQVVEGTPELEVGYMLAHAHWRGGLATEAAAACRDHALAVLRRRRVVSLVRPINLRSQAVALRLGMTVEREVVHRDLAHLLFVTGPGLGG